MAMVVALEMAAETLFPAAWKAWAPRAKGRERARVIQQARATRQMAHLRDMNPDQVRREQVQEPGRVEPGQADLAQGLLPVRRVLNGHWKWFRK